MAFEILDKPQENGNGRYWSPAAIGDSIEGNIVDFEEDNWGNSRIVLEVEDGSEKVLPSHRDLLSYNRLLNIGDYILVKLVRIQKSNDERYADKKIYSVGVDKERKVEYEDVGDFDEYY